MFSWVCRNVCKRQSDCSDAFEEARRQREAAPILLAATSVAAEQVESQAAGLLKASQPVPPASLVSAPPAPAGEAAPAAAEAAEVAPAEPKIGLWDLPLPKLLQFFPPAGCFRIAHLSADFHKAIVIQGQVVVPWLVCKKDSECDPMTLIKKVSMENVVAAWFLGIPAALDALAEALNSGNQRLRDLERFSARGCKVDLSTLPLLKQIFASGQLYLLNLELNQLVDKTLEALVSEILLHDQGLEILNIRTNKVSNAGAEALAQLAHHPTLRILNLKANSIGAPGAAALAGLLELNSNLHVLNLRAQTPKLPKAAGISLARSLCTNGTLRRIKLRRNRMDDEVAAAFVEPLTTGAARHSLLELDLQQNILTAVGGAALARLLTRNDVLEIVYVGGHNFGSAEVSARIDGAAPDERMEFAVCDDV